MFIAFNISDECDFISCCTNEMAINYSPEAGISINESC